MDQQNLQQYPRQPESDVPQMASPAAPQSEAFNAVPGQPTPETPQVQQPPVYPQPAQPGVPPYGVPQMPVYPGATPRFQWSAFHVLTVVLLVLTLFGSIASCTGMVLLAERL